MYCLNELMIAAHLDAMEHGLWEPTDGCYEAALKVKAEAKELLDEAMNMRFKTHNGEEPESESISAYAYELADVIIMALSAAGHLDIDIQHYVESKMRINKERPYKHAKE